MRRLAKIVFWGLISVALFILITNVWIISTTSSQIYNEDDIPNNDVALVLGTSKKTNDGRPNLFFVERMSAAADLYEKQRIKHLLVSGDNSSKYYNEPRDMLKALGDLSVPASDISLDYAGFRTLDSVVRSKEVFGQKSITIVTQKFHCYRSLFIANKFGINAVAFAADRESAIGMNLAFREVLARAYAVVDLYIFQKQPKFLGEEIRLEIR